MTGPDAEPDTEPGVDAMEWSPEVPQEVRDALAERVAVAMDRDPWDELVSPISGRSLYYDRTGKPITMRQWSRVTEGMYGSDPRRRRKILRRVKRVGSDYIGPYWLSTVWLGMDHGFGMGPPLIFESMAFGKPEPSEFFEGKHRPGDQFNICERYATERAALRGHLALRRLVRVLWHASAGPRPLAVKMGKRHGRRR